MNYLNRTALLAFLALAATATPAPSQITGESVARSVAERWEGRMRGVRDYTVVMQVMGMELTHYFERDTVDGKPGWKSRRWTRVGEETVGAVEERFTASPADEMKVFMEAGSRLRYEGADTAAGRPVHVLAIEDFAGMLAHVPAAARLSGASMKARILVDRERSLPLRIVVEGRAAERTLPQPFTMTMSFADHRDTEGVILPYRTTFTVAGVGPRRTEKQVAEMVRSMERLRAQIRGLKEGERRALEALVSPEMQRMFLTGTLEFTSDVQSVRVNAGPPALPPPAQARRRAPG